jgi:hypothetical protein
MRNSGIVLLLAILLLLGVGACQRGPEIAAGTGTEGRVEAVARNGELYQTRNSRSAITLISSDELEYRVDNTTLLCRYTDQGNALRVIMTALGTQQVLYFRRVPNGLMSNDGILYLNATGLGEIKRHEEIARKQQMEQEAAVERERIERERVAAIVAAQQAQREAEQRHAAEEIAREKAEANRRETLKAVETSSCTEGEYNVAARSELTFALNAKRECWTPWLSPENKYGWGLKETGDVLVQLMFADSSLGEEFEDGPTKRWSNNRQTRALRFKSLRKESVQITLTVR